LSSNTKKTKEKITMFENTNTGTMSLYYQSCDKQNRDIRNGNWKLYIIAHYCRKYPDDPGDQLINDEDVVQPENHLWADHTESKKWRSSIDRKGNTCSTTYGLCNNCYISGPINMECINGCGEYKAVQHGNYAFDCQTVAEKLGKNHTKAMASRKQKWLRTTCHRFDMQMICMRIETKHKHIEDAEERKRTLTQEYEDFMEDYECIIYGRTQSPEP
jgi:hypothetical protein